MGERGSARFTVGLTELTFVLQLEGFVGGWRAVEHLGAGSAQSLLTLHFYSEVSRLTLCSLPLIEEGKKATQTHTGSCWGQTTLRSYKRCEAWSCSPSGKRETYSFDRKASHAALCTLCSEVGWVIQRITVKQGCSIEGDRNAFSSVLRSQYLTTAVVKSASNLSKAVDTWKLIVRLFMNVRHT